MTLVDMLLGKSSLASRKPAQPLSQRALLRRETGIEPIPLICEEIAIGAEWIIDIESDYPELVRWLPFNAIVVDNSSATDVEVHLNQSVTSILYVASGTIKKYSQASLYSLGLLHKRGAAVIAAGELVVTLQVEGEKELWSVR